MEYLDLYDKNRIKTGETMLRGSKMPKDRYRLVVRVIVFNSEGKMLTNLRVYKDDKHEHTAQKPEVLNLEGRR